ncbi:unnamed protein product [Orchesella dallaii]|uniref:Tudor domain-containing protein n=1 Tax=Orchesella dallaii TaxID=48710 RepID=A0ABP1Q4U1_9HEXA
MSAENKALMTRVIVGVASVGATLALVYLYNKFQQKKGKDGDTEKSSGGISKGSRIRKLSAKSGEVTKKVTFKTTEDEEEKAVKAVQAEAGSSSDAVAENDSKFLRNELNTQTNIQIQPVAAPSITHEDTMTSGSAQNSVTEGQPDPLVRGPEQLSSSSASLLSTTADGESSCNTAIINPCYENNSTLKIEDSALDSTRPTTNTNQSKPTTSSSPPTVDKVEEVQEEVITRSSEGPLMTSTPLPSKDPSGHFFSRPHSDLAPSSSQGEVPQGAQPVSTSVVTPETDYDQASYRKEIKIPREIVPGLIGKKGVNIKGIQAQSNTTINFHDETLDNGDRLCVIRGSPANVTIAESLIEKFITEQPIIYTETVTVPLSSVGRIIGRGGETIRTIQEQSKARVNVESHNHYGNGDSGPTRLITIKGSEEQILIARQLIIEKVEEERHLRKNIDMTTASRTPRRPGGISPSPSSPSVSLGPSGSSSSAPMNTGSTEPALPLKQNGILEVFVSCVYHPNDFWIQVVGRDSIELDKLCESMTDFYSGRNEPREDSQFNVGDIVAAPFEVDCKIYRAKIMQISDNGVEVSYLDYGDRRVLSISEIHELHPNFLQLRFQAIQATLNLGCIGDTWNDETINEFCDRTYCAQWQSLTAKVKDYLKDVEDGHDVIWIELLDKDANIGEDLVRKRLATPKGPSGCNGAQNFQKKSYAAVALGVGASTAPVEPLITTADPTIQESLEHDRNGN